MATHLEKIFKEKADKEGLEILKAQWEYDKHLVPEALKTINNIFPHYSLHDESHSESIINNITNVLSEKVVEELGVTDLWLILESTYCHDLGMVITADKIIEALNAKEDSFIDYFNNIISDASNPSYEEASHFVVKDGKLNFKDAEFTVEAFDSMKFLLSGYFRSYHAKNSKDVIIDPMGKLSMASPRIVIPQRLYTVLGEICACHTKNFSAVMELPQVENGLTIDKAHPRFVASLLRVGDVLDMDNNRFSEMVLRTIKKMPKDSKEHYDKHRSVTHIRVDNRHIEAKAECPNPSVAKITNQWFDWIRQEFNDLSSHWNDVKPYDLTCALPTIRSLETQIAGGYYNYKASEMHQFSINTGKALELLQGNNFYENIWDSIRELLQNAVDSTLIRYFLEKEYECKEQGKELTFDFYKSLDELKKYPIEVNLVKGDDGIFTLTIKDNGLGLKRDHLKFLSNTGNSSNNLEKKKIVERMPEWLKPSGTFGIGFQSVYLLTDKVDIVTKDYFTDECYELEMHKPSSAMKGDIYVKKHEERIHNSGLELKLKLNSPKVNKLDEEKPDVFDAIGGVSRIEYEISKKVREYGEISLVPISYKGAEIIRKESLYFDKENGIELMSLENVNRFSSKLNLYFRNAEIKHGISNYFFRITANILHGKASDMLGISRDLLKEEYYDNIKGYVLISIKRWILSEGPDSDKIVEKNRDTALKLFAMYYGYAEELKPVLGNYYDFEVDMLARPSDVESERFTPSLKNGIAITFNDLKGGNRIETVYGRVNNVNFVMYDENEKKYSINLTINQYSNIVINKILNSTFDNCYLHSYTFNEYVFSNTDIFSDIKEVRHVSYEVVNTRLYYPYIPGYDDIYIPSGKGRDVKGIGLVRGLLSSKMAKILSPFLLVNDEIVDSRNGKFYQFVHECNGKPIEKIKECYDRFVEYVVNKKGWTVKKLEYK